MRPPASAQLLTNRPAIKPVDLDGNRILLTGASTGIGEAAAEQFGHHPAGPDRAADGDRGQGAGHHRSMVGQ
jgi:NAD(P)-dependent dehydrogenase (short-subunit alcohol dehydrogenase family)